MGFPTTANRGKHLEKTVVASQGGVVRLHQTAPETKFLRGGKSIIKTGPPDFIGCVVGSGRMICFDAKTSDRPTGLRCDAVKAHQLDFLCRFGREGAVAGVLAEYTGDSPEAGYYWSGWVMLSKRNSLGASSIPWDAMAYLGPPSHNIDFRNVPGVSP